MTGFGESRSQQDGLSVAVEVRTINSRYFKLSIRGSEGYGLLDSRIEQLVRQTIHRGTVQINLRMERTRSCESYRLNTAVLSAYLAQLKAITADPVPVSALLSLPGVADDQSQTASDPETDWPFIQAAVTAAMENLAEMRAAEGQAMANDLVTNCRAIAAGLDEVERRAPLVLDGYRERLNERLKKVLSEYQVAVDPSDLIREVGLFAERSDISEEIVRLRSHLSQFDSIMALPESSGRKLEFLTQEMFREANTIGSKANDVEIAKAVIEIKTAIERIREMIQNIE